MAEVYLFANAEKVVSALDTLGIEDFRHARVVIKLHMGGARQQILYFSIYCKADSTEAQGC